MEILLLISIVILLLHRKFNKLFVDLLNKIIYRYIPIKYKNIISKYLENTQEYNKNIINILLIFILILLFLIVLGNIFISFELYNHITKSSLLLLFSVNRTLPKKSLKNRLINRKNSNFASINTTKTTTKTYK